ncbi:MAG: hypothetical protein ACI935_000332 [Moritella dasanensis]|jgi:hypothetical protein
MARLKHILYISLLLIAYAQGCALASEPLNIGINNTLARCFQVEHHFSSSNKGIPILKIEHKNKKNIADCGCKSNILSYSIAIVVDDSETIIVAGQLVQNTTNSFNIPLTKSQNIIDGHDLNITLACAASIAL